MPYKDLGVRRKYMNGYMKNVYWKRWPEKLKAKKARHAQTEGAKQRARLYAQNHKEEAIARANVQRAKHYGLTHEEWKEIDSRRKISLCEICGCPATGAGRNSVLHIDHCHVSGKFRGLVCHQCNIGLGCFRDNIEYLLAAVNYLRGKS